MAVRATHGGLLNPPILLASGNPFALKQHAECVEHCSAIEGDKGVASVFDVVILGLVGSSAGDTGFG
jgi:hypothetical protein